MQKFKFPMEYLRVTQGENDTYSHAGSLAMDFGGKDTGSDKLYCPCDMIVKRCRRNATGEMYLESVEPVLFADGTSDYARLLCMHDGSFNATEGAILAQGTHFYDEGGMGSGNPNKFATHVHIEAGKGKWKSTTQSKNGLGTYVIENQAHLYDLFVVGDDVQILNDAGYDWVKESSLKENQITDTAVYGVDVSHNRSANIMKNIKAKGKAQFAIMRVGIGSSSEDKHLAQYIQDSEGMKRGFFSINYFNSNADAVAEADFLVDTIQKYGFTPDKVDLPIFCDWEGLSYEWNKGQGIEITPAQLQEMTAAYCERLIERGYKAGVYLSLNFWRNWYGDDYFVKHPNFYIWYARPGYSKPDRDCYLWQYACDEGTEFGANEPLDKNILFGEYVQGKPTDSCAEHLARIEELEQERYELNKALQQLNILYQSTRSSYVQLMEMYDQLKANYDVAIEENTELVAEVTDLRLGRAKSFFQQLIELLFGKK